jgi:hypothetical protein
MVTGLSGNLSDVTGPADGELSLFLAAVSSAPAQ